MSTHYEKIKEAVETMIQESVGVPYEVNLVTLEDSTQHYAVVNVIFPNQRKYPKEFKNRVSDMLRDSFKRLTIESVRIFLNRIIWR